MYICIEQGHLKMFLNENLGHLKIIAGVDNT